MQAAALWLWPISITGWLYCSGGSGQLGAWTGSPHETHVADLMSISTTAVVQTFPQAVGWVKRAVWATSVGSSERNALLVPMEPLLKTVLAARRRAA